MLDLAVTLKDYTASLSDFYASLGHESALSIVKHGLLFGLHSIWVCFVYVLSFGWFTDFIELPATLKHNTMSILEGANIIERNMDLESVYTPVVGDSSLHHKGLMAGLLNSFFLSLPVTVPHLLMLRALYLNGPEAALGYGFGTIAGQALFLFLVLFGWQWVIIPWIKLESITLLVGMYILVQTMCDILGNVDVEICELRKPGVPFTAAPNPKAIARLKKYFWTNFRLVWFEQICVFNYFGNLTFGGSSTVLQTSNAQGWMYLFHTFFYWVGLNLGSIFFLFFFIWVAIHAQRRFTRLIGITFGDFATKVHCWGGAFILACAFHHVPYYGVDYITTKVFGFLDQDKALERLLHPKENFRFEDPWQEPSQEWESVDMMPMEEEEAYDLEFNFNPKPFDDENYRGNGAHVLSYEEVNFPPESKWASAHNIKEFDVDIDDDVTENVVEDLMQRFGDRNPGLSDKQKIKFRVMYTQLDKWIDVPAYANAEFDRSYKEDSRRREAYQGEVIWQERNTWSILFKEDPQESALDFLSGRIFRDDNLEYYEQGHDFDQWEMCHRDFRELYSNNKVYRTLMQMVSLASLNNQFASSNLNVADEYDIYQRRYILQHYLDFVCDYKNTGMQWEDNFKDSFAHRVYNQQFKGTLAVLGQYSAADLNFPDVHWPDNEFIPDPLMVDFYPSAELNKPRSKPVRKPLTYDQPLFNRYHDEHLDWLHEELYSEVPESWWPNLIDDGQGKGKKRLVNNLWNRKKQTKYNQRLREKFKDALSFPAPGLNDQLRHMVLNDSGPFYMGWDASHQKLIVRGSRLPTQLDMGERQGSSPTQPDKWSFQAWPRQTHFDHFMQRIRSPFMHNTTLRNFRSLDQATRFADSMKDGQNLRWRYEYLVREYEAFDATDNLWDSTFSRRYREARDPEDMDNIGSLDPRDLTIDEPENQPLDPADINFTNPITRIGFTMNHAEHRKWEKHMYRRFPNFIWYWRFVQARAEDYNKNSVPSKLKNEDWTPPKYDLPLRGFFLHIGQPLPPRLDGIAWPAIDKPNLDRTNLPKSQYARWKHEARPHLSPGYYYVHHANIYHDIPVESDIKDQVKELEAVSEWIKNMELGKGMKIQPAHDPHATNTQPDKKIEHSNGHANK